MECPGFDGDHLKLPLWKMGGFLIMLKWQLAYELIMEPFIKYNNFSIVTCKHCRGPEKGDD